MSERHTRSVRQIRLSPQALFAAEQVAGIAGLPVADLLEVVLLELADSGVAVETGLARKRQQGRPHPKQRPAEVIPIERARLSPQRAPGRRLSRRRPVAATRPALKATGLAAAEGQPPERPRTRGAGTDD